jgi:hypothetical protein
MLHRLVTRLIDAEDKREQQAQQQQARPQQGKNCSAIPEAIPLNG